MPLYLIWAYHGTSDAITYHGDQNRGFREVIFVPAIAATTTTMTMVNTVAPTTGQFFNENKERQTYDVKFGNCCCNENAKHNNLCCTRKYLTIVLGKSRPMRYGLRVAEINTLRDWSKKSRGVDQSI